VLVAEKAGVRWHEQTPAVLASAAAAAAMVSIAASQILLGLSLVALLATQTKFRFPPVAIPLGLFMTWTIVSLAASGHAGEGLPQVKKFYVYLMLVAVYSAIRSVTQVRWMAYGWLACATLSSAWGLQQFLGKYRAAQAAHVDFYVSYVASRITGFMGHWMTFSGEMMLALMVTGAILLFDAGKRTQVWVALGGLVIGCGLLAAQTRSMWGGALVGGIYLLWFGRKWMIVALPVVFAAVLFANPFDIRERAVSIVQPHGELDSNRHRAVLRAIGWEMIKAHPLLGVGPEQVGPRIKEYVPASISQPLPDGYYGHLHNIYFHYAAERGIPAMLAILWMFGQALLDFGRALRAAAVPPKIRWVLHAAVAGTLAMMFAGFYEVNLGDSEVLAAFLGLVAAGYVALDEFRSGSR
jgi:putative inorganic carbon (hco3(-)) transporter